MTQGGEGGPGAEAVAMIASAALLAAVLAPMREHWQGRPSDSFPFSCYPMFTAKRSATGTVTHLVGVDGQGRTRVLPHGLLGPGGLNQVRRQLRRAVRKGRAEVTCRLVADRVAAAKGRRYDDVVEVRVVTGTYRFDDYFSGTTRPHLFRVHASRPTSALLA
jgi:hypothetical protein